LSALVVVLLGTTLSLPAGVGRLLLASGYALAGAAALGVMGVWLSSLTSSGPAATAATVGVAIVLQIVGAIEPLSAVRPFLLTTYWPRLLEVFRAPIAWAPPGQPHASPRRPVARLLLVRRPGGAGVERGVAGPDHVVEQLGS
jgi:hypothetical protein